MRSLLKRILALSLIILLILSLVPAAFAEGVGFGKDEKESLQRGTGLLPTLPHGSTTPSKG